MAKEQAPIAPDLLEMKEKLAELRSSQRTRAPLPPALWETIVQLARKHGLQRTAKSLPIDYGTLKRRLNGEPARCKPVAASFVELITPQSAITGCVIEMFRIETKGAVDWAQLLDAWRRRGA